MIEKYKKLLQDSEDAILVDDENSGKDIQDWLMEMPIKESAILIHLFKKYETDEKGVFFDIAKRMPERKIFSKLNKYYSDIFPDKDKDSNLPDFRQVSKYLDELKEEYSDLTNYVEEKEVKWTH